jgi:hypothetical protein
VQRQALRHAGLQFGDQPPPREYTIKSTHLKLWRSLQAKTAADEGYGSRQPGLLQPRGRSPTGLPSLRDGIAHLQREEQAAPWPGYINTLSQT